jgi:hypothetical protein
VEDHCWEFKTENKGINPWWEFGMIDYKMSGKRLNNVYVCVESQTVCTFKVSKNTFEFVFYCVIYYYRVYQKGIHAHSLNEIKTF